MGASLLVFSNKVDVAGGMTDREIREVRTHIASPCKLRTGPLTDHSMQGLQLDAIKTHKWTIIRCSAITGENLIAGLQWVVQDAKDRLFLY